MNAKGQGGMRGDWTVIGARYIEDRDREQNLSKVFPASSDIDDHSAPSLPSFSSVSGGPTRTRARSCTLDHCCVQYSPLSAYDDRCSKICSLCRQGRRDPQTVSFVNTCQLRADHKTFRCVTGPSTRSLITTPDLETQPSYVHHSSYLLTWVDPNP